MSLLWLHVASARADTGELLFMQRCAVCHPKDDTSARAPGLGGVVGRKAAALHFAYTPALVQKKLVWTRANLDRFLASPEQMVPGTNMPLPTPEAKDRRALISYLATLPATRGIEKKETASAPTNPAFGDWHADTPGKTHHISVADLPAPFATRSSTNGPRLAPRGSRVPVAPAGFRVELYASGLSARVLRTAPNGDVFAAETSSGRVRVFRGTTSPRSEVFAEGLDAPFGIAFYPANDPRWVYVAEQNDVVRFPYTRGDLHAEGPPQRIIAELAPTSGGHTTRDLLFTADGKRLLVSIGSGSNVAEGIAKAPTGGIFAWEKMHGLGAAWDGEAWRADVVSFDPEGGDRRPYATGLRNCVGLALSPVTHEPWCATNERDGLGDNLVPDHVTHVTEGAFYGWPFYYLGNHEEPRLAGLRPDLATKVTVPDVLVQPHSAALGMTFYDGQAFTAPYAGSAFVALHGSWNRARRTGYKVVRIPVDAAGRATGMYEDFLTGFVVDDDHVWGRPVGIAVASDGALLVAEDAAGTIWRVSQVR
ncbi:MAG: PQQ-dependent sugar dehydrogenase [Polyangia bacterium]